MTSEWRNLILLSLIFCAVCSPRGRANESAADLKRGLIAYWPLDDNVGDVVSGQRFGPLRNSGSFVAGTVDQSLRFSENGEGHVGAYLPAPGSPRFAAAREFTLSTWYRIDSLGGRGEKSAFKHARGALGWYNPDDLSRYYFLTAYRQSGSGERKVVSLPTQLGTKLSVWHHIVQRVDADGKHTVWHAAINSGGHVYGSRATQELPSFDGVALADESSEEAVALALYEKKGDKGGGAISADEIALWDRALSNAEVQRLFLLGRGGHRVTAEISAEELGAKEAAAGSLSPLRDFGWTSRWVMIQEKTQGRTRLQPVIKSTGEFAIEATDVIVLERRFPAVSSGKLKVEYRLRPRYVTVEVHAPGASGMKTYLRDSRVEGSWTMRWHYPWAWPAIGGNTVPRFYVIDGRGSKRKGLEYTDILMRSERWYTVATVLNLDDKSWEFWVDGQKFDSGVHLGRSTMRWWKTAAQQVDTLRFMSHGTNWIDSFRVYHDDELIASTDFTAEEGYLPGQSLFAFPHASE